MTDPVPVDVSNEDARVEYERAGTNLDLEPIRSEDEDYDSAPPDYQIASVGQKTPVSSGDPRHFVT